LDKVTRKNPDFPDLDELRRALAEAKG